MTHTARASAALNSLRMGCLVLVSYMRADQVNTSFLRQIGMTTLGPLAVLLLLCVPAMAKQPSPEEIGPRIYRCEVRDIRDGHPRHIGRWIRLPAVPVGEPSEAGVQNWGLPGDWYYVIPSDVEGLPPYFERSGERPQRLSVESMIEIGGLPW